ncbi:MAG: chemotaxis protein CheD [Pseudomonadota bacterium]
MNTSAPAQIVDIYLEPGEFYFGEGRARLTTLLGSCVAITLWHPRYHVGGMCHFMLPGRARDPRAPLNGKYADEAMEMFQRETARCGTRISDYQIKLFGGGSVLEVPERLAQVEHVAQQNVQAARQLMMQHGLNAKAESLGGIGYRKIIFELWSGDVWSRFVSNVSPAK